MDRNKIITFVLCFLCLVGCVSSFESFKDERMFISEFMEICKSDDVGKLKIYFSAKIRRKIPENLDEAREVLEVEIPCQFNYVNIETIEKINDTSYHAVLQIDQSDILILQFNKYHKHYEIFYFEWLKKQSGVGPKAPVKAGKE